MSTKIIHEILLFIKKYILWLMVILLFLLPQIMMGKTYSAGGDDMRLYYVFPEKYLTNYTFNISSDNTLAGAQTGYNSVAYFAPILAIIFLFKKIFWFLNVQSFIYGLNMSLGFLGMYCFISLWTRGKRNVLRPINIMSSLLYIFSPYLINTFYKHQLMGIYLISIVPWVFYLFIKGVRENKIELGIISVIIYSIFSATVNTLPYSAAFFYTSIPLLFITFLKYKKTFILHSIAVFISFITINMYWIFHEVYQQMISSSASSVFNQFSSPEFIRDNERIILGVSKLFSPINQITGQMIMGKLTTLPAGVYLGLIFTFLIVLAGIYVRKNNKLNSFYYLSLISFLISWYLFSPNMGNWGPQFFVFLNKIVPFFGMFRNMFDKFALSVAFFYSLIIVISLEIIILWKNTILIRRLIFTLLFITIIINVYSYIKLFKTPEIEHSKFSGEFNKDFNDLANFLALSTDQSRILWIPLNSPTYVNIEDTKSNFYSGLSPLRELANKSDYAGRFSFMLPNNIFFGDELIFDLLESKKYLEMGEIFQKMNVGYVILDNHQVPDYFKDYYFDPGQKILNPQNNDFKNELIGEKIGDFGTRYSLYKINSKYRNDKIYISTEKSNYLMESKVNYIKINSNEYRLSISNIREEKELIFLEPYSVGWTPKLSNGNSNMNANFPHGMIFDYANSWTIDPNFIKNNYPKEFYSVNEDQSINLNLVLSFYPSKYNKYIYGVSIISTLFLSLFVILKIKNRNLSH
jgi:hypothetical protein